MSNFQEVSILSLSSGKLTGGNVTAAVDGTTFDIAEGTAFRSSNAADGSLKSCRWPALLENAISDGATKYVIVDNAGSGQAVRIASTDDSNGYDSFLLWIIIRVGTTLYTIPGKSAIQAAGLVRERLLRSLVTQSSTSIPVGTIIKTEFGDVTFTWARTSAGLYTLTASAPVFTANKTAVKMSNELGALHRFKYAVTSTTVLTFTTNVISEASTVTPTDGLLTATLIDVFVFV